MLNFLNNFIPINLKCYFKNITKVHSHSTRSSKTTYFLPRFKNINGHKLLVDQGSKLWTDLHINLKD